MLDTARLRAIRAGVHDAAQVQGCFEGARDYFVLTNGAPPTADAARRLLEDVEADDRRLLYLLVPRTAATAVGVLDLHLDYPEPGTAQIGLLLLRTAHRGARLGSEVVAATETALASAGYRALRAAVLEPNADAKAFWEAIGFADVGPIDVGVTLYEKVLPGGAEA